MALLPNGDFETGDKTNLYDDDGTSPCDGTIVSDVKYAGTYSLKISV